MAKVFDWAEEGIPHFLIEYPDDGFIKSRDYPTSLDQRRRSVAATLLGQCNRGHLVELSPNPDYVTMRIGCPRRFCPGIVRPATEDVVTTFRLLGKVEAEMSYIRAWHEGRRG